MQDKQNKLFKLILSYSIGLISIVSYSQNYSSAVGFLGGYAQNGYAGMINYNYYTDRFHFFQFSAYYSHSTEKYKTYKVPFQIITANAGYMYNFYNNRRHTFFVHVGGGGVGGYEVVNNNRDYIDNGARINERSKFIYGVYASFELEYYLSNNLSFMFKASEYYHPNSDLGELTPFVGVGLRYFLY